jgi:hypothetical protein
MFPLLRIEETFMPVHRAEENEETIVNAIQRRAFELFEMRGCEPGRDLEDWLQAEQEILYGSGASVDESTESVDVTNEEELAVKGPTKEKRPAASRIVAA